MVTWRPFFLAHQEYLHVSSTWANDQVYDLGVDILAKTLSPQRLFEYILLGD